MGFNEKLSAHCLVLRLKMLLGRREPALCFRLCNRSRFFFQFPLVRSAWPGGVCLRTPPWTPHAPRGSTPWNPLGFAGAVDMGLSLRSSSLPLVGKALLRGFGSLLLRCTQSGVSLRAMPRPEGLSREVYFSNFSQSSLEVAKFHAKIMLSIRLEALEFALEIQMCIVEIIL